MTRLVLIREGEPLGRPDYILGYDSVFWDEDAKVYAVSGYPERLENIMGYVKDIRREKGIITGEIVFIDKNHDVTDFIISNVFFSEAETEDHDNRVRVISKARLRSIALVYNAGFPKIPHDTPDIPYYGD